MKKYDIYKHRLSYDGGYRVFEVGSDTSIDGIHSRHNPDYVYYGTINEDQCFFELIDDDSADGDVIVSSLGNDAALDGSYENFMLNAKEWADGEFANYDDQPSCSCSLVKRCVAPEGVVELEVMYETTIYNEEKIDELINALDNYSCRITKEEDGTFDLSYEVVCNWGGVYYTSAWLEGYVEETPVDWGKIINEVLADDDTFCWFEDLLSLSYDELIDVFEVLKDNNTKLDEIKNMDVQEWYDNHND